MPAQGLETDCLVGRLKCVLEGVVQRNVSCSCARSSSGDEMVTVRDRASAIYYKHARDNVSTRSLRGILTDGRVGESEDYAQNRNGNHEKRHEDLLVRRPDVPDRSFQMAWPMRIFPLMVSATKDWTTLNGIACSVNLWSQTAGMNDLYCAVHLNSNDRLRSQLQLFCSR